GKRFLVAQVDAVNGDARFRAAGYAQGKDTGNDGNGADVQPVGVLAGPVVAVADGEHVRARRSAAVAQQASAVRDDLAGRVGKLENRFKRFGVGRHGLHADFLTGRRVEAVEVHCACALRRADDGDRQGNLLGATGRVVAGLLFLRVEAVAGLLRLGR